MRSTVLCRLRVYIWSEAPERFRSSQIGGRYTDELTRACRRTSR